MFHFTRIAKLTHSIRGKNPSNKREKIRRVQRKSAILFLSFFTRPADQSGVIRKTHPPFMNGQILDFPPPLRPPLPLSDPNTIKHQDLHAKKILFIRAEKLGWARVYSLFLSSFTNNIGRSQFSTGFFIQHMKGSGSFLFSKLFRRHRS